MISSLVLSNVNLTFALRFLAAGVPSVSHSLKFALSRRYLPSIHESPFDFSLGVFYLVELVAKEMVGGLLISSMHGIHNVFQL